MNAVSKVTKRTDKRIERSTVSVGANPHLIWSGVLAHIWVCVRAVFLIGVSYIILLPLLTKISSSLMSIPDLYDQTVRWIPRHPTLDNFWMAFENMYYVTAFFNSLQLTVLVSVLQLVSCTAIAYGFARFEFPGKNLFFGLVVLTLVIPPQLLMIPYYLHYRYFDFYGLIAKPGLNLLGTFWPFVLTSLTGTGFRNGLFIYIMRQFFKGMPRDLEDAAYVDGAGPLRTFFTIMVPGAIPAQVVVFLFAFVWQWNDYFLTKVFIGSKKVLAVTLEGLVQNVFDKSLIPSGTGSAYASVLENTGSLLFMAPLIILYILLQRYFIESVERTGLVG